MHREIELKFPLADAAPLRGALAAIGARFEGRFVEENYFCDDAAGSLSSGHRILRLRRSRNVTDPNRVEQRLTYKEPVYDESFKVRTEIEVNVGDLDELRTILERIGYAVHFDYRKEREIWLAGEVCVTIDTLPFGQFAELEGQPDAIRNTARALGLDFSQGITKSYLTLIEENRGGQ